MAKRIICKPAPELEIEINGGDIVLLRFDVNMMCELQELEGGITGLFERTYPEMAACIIYAAAKNNNENYTHEDARALVANMSIDTINDVINEFSESVGILKNEAQEELAKKMMAQFLQNLK